MYILIPQATYLIYNEFLSTTIASLIRLTILFFLFPLIVPFSGSISNVISMLSSTKEEEQKAKYAISINAVESGTVSIGDNYKTNK
jgi:hypothetical protein